MTDVHAYLQTLWDMEKVSASTILTDDEKKVVVKDLLESLPFHLMVVSAKDTYKIVGDKLSNFTSIKPKDEEPIDSTNNRPKPQEAPVPRTYYKGKSQDKKSSTPL